MKVNENQENRNLIRKKITLLAINIENYVLPHFVTFPQFQIRTLFYLLNKRHVQHAIGLAGVSILCTMVMPPTFFLHM